MTSTTLHSPPRPRPATSKTWCGAAAIVLAVTGVALVGGIVTAPAVRTWYAGLPRPAWTPPELGLRPGVDRPLRDDGPRHVWARRDRV